MVKTQGSCRLSNWTVLGPVINAALRTVTGKKTCIIDQKSQTGHQALLENKGVKTDKAVTGQGLRHVTDPGVSHSTWQTITLFCFVQDPRGDNGTAGLFLCQQVNVRTDNAVVCSSNAVLYCPEVRYGCDS